MRRRGRGRGRGNRSGRGREAQVTLLLREKEKEEKKRGGCNDVETWAECACLATGDGGTSHTVLVISSG